MFFNQRYLSNRIFSQKGHPFCPRSVSICPAQSPSEPPGDYGKHFGRLIAKSLADHSGCRPIFRIVRLLLC
ncbi:hypothetical protein JTE90_004798 [Oedothorax gibbosus]|uniref:Uncharacterized protein n=1 Tax=Oedothorax gibbosus TaxID=931172 RepID=A0AAV6VGJ2_9ARAC|nr:hypothetical protein JTE90_004798 [Oedothorax gibbosus]